jgi:predicted DNA-binding transcriptional regulator YafY
LDAILNLLISLTFIKFNELNDESIMSLKNPRIIRMIELVTTTPQTTRQIWKKLQDESKDFKCDVRTVQRDLVDLDGSYNIYGQENPNRKNSYIWVKDSLGFSESKNDNITAALALVTARKQLSITAPPEIFGQLDISFEHAATLLEKAGSNIAKWRKKVRVVNLSHWLKSPTLDSDVLKVITASALNNYVVNVQYKAHPHDPAIKIKLTGLGLFYRGPVAYFIAYNHKTDAVRNYPLSRIVSAVDAVTESPKGIEGFDIDEYENNHILAYSYGKPFRLKAKIFSSVQREIVDAHLGDNQIVTPLGEDDKFQLLEVDVPYTLNLIQWLIARAPYLKVLGPPDFKEKFEEEIKRAYYNVTHDEPCVPEAKNFRT